MMKKLYLFFFLVGALSACAYVFPSLWFLPWFSLIPFAYILMTRVGEMKKRQAYLLGFLFGMGYFGLTYHWFINFYEMDLIGLTGLESAALVAVCWIGLSALQAFEFGFFPVIFKLVYRDKPRPWLGALTIPALWMIYEWQQTLFWRGVPWARLALTQSGFRALQQSASLFGSIFVSGIIIAFASLIAAAVFYLLEMLRKEERKFSFKNIKLPKKSAVLCIAAAGIFLLNLLFGAIKLAVPTKTVGDEFCAAVVQGNISSADKWNTTAREAANVYLDLTEKCVNEAAANGKTVKLVVWPETVLKDGIIRYAGIATDVSSSAKELGITILAGAFEAERVNDEILSYNSIYAFYPDGSVDDTCYRKQRLVPFGEFTPMEDVINTLLPILTELNILSSNPYTPGDDSTVFKGAGDGISGIGSLICFDSIYETLTVSSVRNGAKIMTLSTNDSWFSDSAAVYQHNRHATLRAIESGRYFVRAANTGVSSIISPTGEILTEVDPLVEGYTYHDVALSESRTLYSYVGNLTVYISLAFYVGLISYNIAKKKIKQ